MNKIDPKIAARVWQRVQGEQDAGEERFQTLIYRERELSSACTRLASALPKKAKLLKDAAQAANARAVCLRGMGYLTSGSRPAAANAVKKTEAVDSVVRKCCLLCRNAITEYDARGEHPQYGCVFAQMAQEHRAHYRLFLELLG